MPGVLTVYGKAFGLHRGVSAGSTVVTHCPAAGNLSSGGGLLQGLPEQWLYPEVVRFHAEFESMVPGADNGVCVECKRRRLGHGSKV